MAIQTAFNDAFDGGGGISGDGGSRGEGTAVSGAVVSGGDPGELWLPAVAQSLFDRGYRHAQVGSASEIATVTYGPAKKLLGELGKPKHAPPE